MFRKKDWVVIAVGLALAVLVYGGTRLARQGQKLAGTVEVYVGDIRYATAPLGVPRDIVVEQETGEINIVRIDAQGVHMEHSNCINQLCVQQGEVTSENWTRRALGRQIICLPNRVIVSVAIEGAAQGADIPDI
ncbi:lipoprotein [Clostridia bacterium]|nr:lipoprotein [Clostridia bacterium]